MTSRKNNANLTTSKKSLANVKLHLNTIINNLTQLESMKTSQPPIDDHALSSLMLVTDELLNQLEKTPLERLSKRSKKKALKRLQKHKASKEETNAATTTDWLSTLVQEYSLNTFNGTVTPQESNQPGKPISRPAPKEHHRLYLKHKAEHFQQIFQLLPKLHYARGHDIEASRLFSMKFDELREKWQELLRETETEQSDQCRIEKQWDAVLFGQPEECFYNKPDGTVKFKDFLRIRRTWDSYLTQSKELGTTIPIGWVLPRESADDKWLPYKE